MKTTFKVEAKEVEVVVTGDSIHVVRFLESLLTNEVITKDGSKIYPVVTTFKSSGTPTKSEIDKHSETIKFKP